VSTRAAGTLTTVLSHRMDARTVLATAFFLAEAIHLQIQNKLK
jgi:hypothetical protein